MPEKFAARLGIAFWRSDATSPRATISSKRLAVVTSAERVASSISLSLVVRQVWAEAAIGDRQSNNTGSQLAVCRMSLMFHLDLILNCRSRAPILGFRSPRLGRLHRIPPCATVA